MSDQKQHDSLPDLESNDFTKFFNLTRKRVQQLEAASKVPELPEITSRDSVVAESISEQKTS